MINLNKTAVLGGGCFWCTQAAYKNLNGIKNTTTGYAGGKTKNPTYKEVCTGKTNHAEVIKIKYNPQKITYKQILNFFFKIHNPTTKNKQGPDTGTQYRSIILYKNKKQKQTAKKTIKQKQKKHDNKIVTELKPLKKFYPAEQKHQNYFEKNPKDTYCNLYAKPKIKKAKKFKKTQNNKN